MQDSSRAYTFIQLQGVPINMEIEWKLEYRLLFPIIDKCIKKRLKVYKWAFQHDYYLLLFKMADHILEIPRLLVFGVESDISPIDIALYL